MTIQRLSEVELKRKIQELHHAPSRHFSVVAVIPVQFERIGNVYQAKYFDFYYNFVPR